MVNRSGSGHGSNINKDANVWLEDRTKGVEEPTVRVDLFLVLLLQTEQDLDGDMAAFGPLNVEGGRIDGHWGALAQLYGNGPRTERYMPWVVYS